MSTTPVIPAREIPRERGCDGRPGARHLFGVSEDGTQVDHVGPGIEPAGLVEVDVRVDQPGVDPFARHFDHVRARRYGDRAARTDGGDAAFVHDHDRVGDRRHPGSIDDCGPDEGCRRVRGREGNPGQHARQNRRR